MKTFNAQKYFEDICLKLKLTKDNNYQFCRVTGIGYLEEVIQSFRSSPAYFAIDDTNDGYTHQARNGTFYERRAYTIFILKKYTLGNMEQQHQCLEECRRIYRSVLKRMIKDRRTLENHMVYLKTDRVPFFEMEGYAIAGCTGVYMTISIDQPKNLCYDEQEWYD